MAVKGQDKQAQSKTALLARLKALCEVCGATADLRHGLPVAGDIGDRHP